MIGGIACMQLVEQGALKLDDVESVEKLAPELKRVKVLKDGVLVEKKKGITLRMLLSHTGELIFFSPGRSREKKASSGLWARADDSLFADKLTFSWFWIYILQP
jgi:CubicO group peptidase (beta-lactamase class C family)